MNTETKSERLMSLDTLRGMDMLLITGLPGIIYALVAVLFGCPDAWILKTMQHADWVGFNVMDTVFPLFMFMSGVAFPYSYAKRMARGDSRAKIVGKLVSRMLALIALGLVYNGFCSGIFTNGIAGVRFPSVLGRIGVSWAAAAALYVFCGRGTRIAIALAILLGYWLFCAFVPVPGLAPGANPFGEGLANWPNWLDSRIWLDGNPDPEGVLSSLPAIVTTMGGIFTGEMVRGKGLSGNAKTLWMLTAAAICGVAAWAWSPWCPIVKKLWTPSFVLAAWSYSLAWFAIVYWLVDVRQWRGWTFFFRVIGVNSILVYMMRKIFDFGAASRFFFGGLAKYLGLPWGEVVTAVSYVLVIWLVLLLFYRKGIFLKV